MSAGSTGHTSTPAFTAVGAVPSGDLAPAAARGHVFDPGTVTGVSGVPLASPVLVVTSIAIVVTALGALSTLVLVRRGVGPADAVASRLPPVAAVDERSGGVDPPSLPEDERFVVELLRENGGRLRQSEIVEASDWSKSKVSRLLSSMERDGHVEKVTIGRENAIVLPESDG